MAERRGHPVAAVIIGLLTLLVCAIGVIGACLAFIDGMPGGFDTPRSGPAHPGIGAALVLGVVVVLVGGLWWAWRVGSGYRGRRRFPPPPPPPLLFDEPPPPPG